MGRRRKRREKAGASEEGGLRERGEESIKEVMGEGKT